MKVMKVVLASASPRRQALLTQLVDSFEVLPADVDEEAFVAHDPVELAEGLALMKAEAVAAIRPDDLVIGCDTVVAFQQGGEWTFLAKPVDEADAKRMLRTLSGQTHVVVTGFALVGGGRKVTGHDLSRVTFKYLSDQLIADYVATGEPMDKAGAYGLQDTSKTFLDRLEGSMNNVIGLPIEKLGPALQAFLAG
jgi:septum formation protein